jgi:hypothetical protein
MRLLNSNDSADCSANTDEVDLHWSEWVLVSLAFVVFCSMILHTIYSGM